METIERKIYNGYAFTENEREKAKINYEIYKELKGKYKILCTCARPLDAEEEANDIVYSRKACYGHAEYKVWKRPNEITVSELLLIFDGGNLCFGGYGRSDNSYIINED